LSSSSAFAFRSAIDFSRRSLYSAAASPAGDLAFQLGFQGVSLAQSEAIDVLRHCFLHKKT
jgi:hypothetical protein